MLRDLAETSTVIASESGRLAKAEQLAACLRRLAPDEVAIGVAFLSGELRQRQIGIGYASLRNRPAPAPVPSLTLHEVDATFEQVGRQAGPGSQGERRQLMTALLGRATITEQHFLVQLLTGELRQGALQGLMMEGIARAVGAPAKAVRRALMLHGALGAVAEAALTKGAPGLKAFRLQVGRPIQPMLAQTADSIDTAIERSAPAAVEWKLDGARIQVHRAGETVSVYTRTLDDITARAPEVVEVALGLPVHAVVLDGEVMALREDGRPHPFQVTAGRVGSRLDVDRRRGAVRLQPFFFDLLHLDDEDLIDDAAEQRRTALEAVVPESLLTPRIVTQDREIAAAFLKETLARGHEGVMVKSLAAPYEAGRRGAGWLKVKPVHTFDLVVLAAEWGHGRRRGWLSNLHLGARDPAGGGFVMLGKTFKGMTDAMLRWQTERLLALETSRDDWTVYVRPELVVEVAIDGVQYSPRYPAGLTLRFARVIRYREDKRAEEADVVDTLRALHAG